MKKKLFSGILSILLTLSMLLTLAVPAFAAEAPAEEVPEAPEAPAAPETPTTPAPIPVPDAPAEEEKSPLDVIAHTIALKDNVQIKYAVPAQAGDAKLLFWTEAQESYEYGTHAKEASAAYRQTVNGTRCNIFRYTEMLDHQMTDTLYARAYVLVDGEYQYGEVTKYSILQYAYNKMQDPKTDDALKGKLEALLDKGADAQLTQNYKTDDLANEPHSAIHTVGSLLSDGFRDMLHPDSREVVGIESYLRHSGSVTVYIKGGVNMLGYHIIDDYLYYFEDILGAKKNVSFDGHLFDLHGRIYGDCEFVTLADGKTYYLVAQIIVYHLYVINGKIYHFGNDGVMKINQTADGYQFGLDGTLVGDSLFVGIGDKTYYVNNSEIICTYRHMAGQTYLEANGLLYPTQNYTGSVLQEDENTDPSDNIILPGATCIAKIESLGITFEIKSDEMGKFTFLYLPRVTIIFIFIIEGHLETEFTVDMGSQTCPDNVLLESENKEITVDSGICGDDLTWKIITTTANRDEYQLNIEGNGAMNNYTASSTAPWYSYREQITVVQIAETVTSIGSYAFAELVVLIEIRLPDSITSIGDKAFLSCEILKDVVMPENVVIGVDVFRGSIYVVITILHELVYVPAEEATCTRPGNIAHYACTECDHYYADAEGKDRIYNVEIPAAHNFVSGVCTKCYTVQREVEIVSVDPIQHLGKFALGTMEDAIGLPEKVTVTTASGARYQLPVTWELSDYKKDTVGEYTIRGHIIPGTLIFGAGVDSDVKATIEIVEYMQGTADIVFILDISGSMGDEIANVKNNIVSFAEAIEAQGVSARWSAITYSDYTYSSSKNEQTQIIYNGATPWFTSAVDYRNAINNIRLANGGDSPEAAVDGLMMANTLENRQNARTFYILLTDATYKVSNHYGVTSMNHAAQILDDNGVNVSVIAPTSYYSYYNVLTNTTGGVMANIYSNFAQTLLDRLVPIIYEDVIS